ncbi:DUF4144 family protein [Vibrio harveyi]|uniref:DUF4144 family protein n=1 Tax=Vibrio harveyi TaxID=669 RepID=UPI000682F709|nr:DUF4144 family protein [Vibrio harveyi]MCQ9073199.1 DUF4144 domain-containing protein [Vibrio harveyi]WHP66268.1 DUF4144 family protein [Vibrio harveyi]HDM8051932.1 DUF4144 domain-containing protein [Vibrio harveyi]HDM8148301.1 DUF4144 domain-containing protein [Vibrio harveyi]HDM8190058.1 DUF4144 domain-containing protein [Vibrio harveyi]
MITWPCLLKLDGDDELVYLASPKQLNAECQALIWGQDDIVIDTQGHCFTLKTGANNTVELGLLPQTLSVQQVTELIQKHEFSKAQRCIIKIHFVSVQQAIEALAD